MADHPITPPPELVQQWADEHFRNSGWIDAAGDTSGVRRAIATQAAQWGADQELEACCDVMRANQAYVSAGVLRAIRRPKPPSLKEQALQMLGTIERDAHYLSEITDTIRRALKQLND